MLLLLAAEALDGDGFIILPICLISLSEESSLSQAFHGFAVAGFTCSCFGGRQRVALIATAAQVHEVAEQVHQPHHDAHGDEERNQRVDCVAHVERGREAKVASAVPGQVQRRAVLARSQRAGVEGDDCGAFGSAVDFGD